MSSLFAPLPLGDLMLRNRIALPPLTRCRSEQPGNIPGEMMVDYYRQRASAGFMITRVRKLNLAVRAMPGRPGYTARRKLRDGEK